jgi:MoaA/NifB/PqqE/SkfB family radical SAM enzyme
MYRMISFGRIKKGIRYPKAALNYILRSSGIKYQIPNLSHIVLYINSICNAKCFMCDIGQDKGRGIQQLAYGNKFMPLSTLKKILNDPLVKKRRFSFNIIMTEPLLTPNIREYIKEIKKGSHDVNITTNGYLLPEKAQELIESGLDSIQVSIDGPRRINDWIRGKKGFFDRAIKGIKKLEGRIAVRINYTISNLNYQYLTEFADIINNNVRIGLLKFQFLDFVSEEMSKKQSKYSFKQGVSSVDEFVDPEKIDVEILSEQIKKIKESRYENIHKIVFIPDLFEKKDLQVYFSKDGKQLKNYATCRWPYSQVAINTEGDIFFHMRCFSYKIGNINKEERLNQIFNNRKARYFRREFRKAGFCFPACTRCCGVMFK